VENVRIEKTVGCDVRAVIETPCRRHVLQIMVGGVCVLRCALSWEGGPRGVGCGEVLGARMLGKNSTVGKMDRSCSFYTRAFEVELFDRYLRIRFTLSFLRHAFAL
jgi:hypothetical protein